MPRNIADRRGVVFVADLVRKRGAGEGPDRAFSGGRSPKRGKSPKKSSGGPDFLGFAQKIDIILKKHMFFDKKYILFLPQ